jgi:hypothetical protein
MKIGCARRAIDLLRSTRKTIILATWNRLTAGRAGRVVALGTIAEHGPCPGNRTLLGKSNGGIPRGVAVSAQLQAEVGAIEGLPAAQHHYGQRCCAGCVRNHSRSRDLSAPA